MCVGSWQGTPVWQDTPFWQDTPVWQDTPFWQETLFWQDTHFWCGAGSPELGAEIVECVCVELLSLN